MSIHGLEGGLPFKTPQPHFNDHHVEDSHDDHEQSGNSDSYEGSLPLSAVYGNVSLDLTYGQSEYLSRSYSDGDSSVTQQLYRSYQSSLSLDFSFAAHIEGASEKLKNLDPSVYAEWMKEAGDLFSFSQKDYDEFVDATDELFNEMEKLLGMGSDGLDAVADFFTNQVRGFLDDVKVSKEYFESNPLGKGDDLGLGIPGLMEDRLSGLKNELMAFLEDALATLTKQLEENEPESEHSALKQMADLLEALLQKLRDKEDEEEETPLITGELPKEEDVSNSEALRSLYEFSFSYSKRTTFTAIMEYQRSAGPIDA